MTRHLEEGDLDKTLALIAHMAIWLLARVLIDLLVPEIPSSVDLFPLQQRNLSTNKTNTITSTG